MWGGSDEGFACKESQTLAQAIAICYGAGARLCTVAELEGGCAEGTGCDFDEQLVWAAPLPPPPPPPPPLPPLQPLPPTAPVVCGKPGGCSEAAGLKEADELHEVRLQRTHPIMRLSADRASTLPAATGAVLLRHPAF